jgi:hypothetical protein
MHLANTRSTNAKIKVAVKAKNPNKSSDDEIIKEEAK